MGDAAEELGLRDQLLEAAGMKEDEPADEGKDDGKIDAEPGTPDEPTGSDQDSDAGDDPKDDKDAEPGDGSTLQSSDQGGEDQDPEPDSSGDPQQDPSDGVQGSASPEIKPPQALTGDRKAAWKELPSEWQEEIVRLESAQQKGVQKLAADANYGQTFKQMVQPYQAIINASGTNEQEVVSRLLNANYVLKTGSPAEKSQMLANIAQEYGVPLQDIQQPVNIDPNMQYLMNQNRQLQQKFDTQQANAQQYQQQQVESEIEAFAKDPKNVHFEQVKGRMADVMESPTLNVTTLPEAYDIACKLEGLQIDVTPPAPETPTPTPQPTPKQPKVDAKKKAGSSVKNSGSSAKAKGPKDESLHATIKRQIYGDTQQI